MLESLRKSWWLQFFVYMKVVQIMKEHCNFKNMSIEALTDAKILRFAKYLLTLHKEVNKNSNNKDPVQNKNSNAA